MKILVAHESLDTSGGVESYLSSLLPGLVHRGHEIALLYHRRRESSRPMTLPVDPCIGVDSLGLEGAFDAVRAWRPEVCFSHNMGALEVEERLVREWPVVKMMHGYFGTCASGLKTHAFPAMRACGRTFGPSCIALYVPRHCGQLSAPRLMNGYLWSRRQRALFPRYRAVVVASAYLAREYQQHGVSRDRLHVLPLFSTVDPQESGFWQAGRVLFAGRMTSLKGGHVLIEAAACAARLLGQPVPIIMAGDGPQREEWQGLARTRGVDADFTGWVEPSERSRLFQRASLLAVPSLWPEPFGLVGLEAAALGLPAVAFDVGGIREWLRHGHNGLLVNPSEGAQGLGAAIAALLASPSDRERMAEGARLVEQTMSRSAHLDRLEPLLAQAGRA